MRRYEIPPWSCRVLGNGWIAVSLPSSPQCPYRQSSLFLPKLMHNNYRPPSRGYEGAGVGAPARMPGGMERVSWSASFAPLGFGFDQALL